MMLNNDTIQTINRLAGRVEACLSAEYNAEYEKIMRYALFQRFSIFFQELDLYLFERAQLETENVLGHDEFQLMLKRLEAEDLIHAKDKELLLLLLEIYIALAFYDDSYDIDESMVAHELMKNFPVLKDLVGRLSAEQL